LLLLTISHHILRIGSTLISKNRFIALWESFFHLFAQYDKVFLFFSNYVGFLVYIYRNFERAFIGLFFHYYLKLFIEFDVEFVILNVSLCLSFLNNEWKCTIFCIYLLNKCVLRNYSVFMTVVFSQPKPMMTKNIYALTLQAYKVIPTFG
jgi:hypothetical protein